MSASRKIEAEFDRLCRTNHLFKEYVALHPDSSMDELLAGWKWVQALVEKVIQRTIRDLTSPPPEPKLGMSRDR